MDSQTSKMVYNKHLNVIDYVLLNLRNINIFNGVSKSKLGELPKHSISVLQENLFGALKL